MLVVGILLRGALSATAASFSNMPTQLSMASSFPWTMISDVSCRLASMQTGRNGQLYEQRQHKMLHMQLECLDEQKSL